jgi:phosphohistidine phosphatase
MKNLILMRHGEAQPTQNILNDRERPLTINGLQDLQTMRTKIQGHIESLSMVLCSNVKRTRQTLEGIKPILPSQCLINFEDDLYHASAKALTKRIRAIDDDQKFIMVIGHNPGVSEFLESVVLSTKEFFDSRIPLGFPPCSAAFFEGNFNFWAEAAPARFSLKKFILPSE